MLFDMISTKFSFMIGKHDCIKEKMHNAYKENFGGAKTQKQVNGPKEVCFCKVFRIKPD